MTLLPIYSLVTPARNEAQFIELTLRSVVRQTVLPIRWVIVSDGSTDGTDEIVRKYTGDHTWIELVRMPERQERTFVGKAHAFKAGYARLAGLKYDVIGNLDGDTSFDEEYFATLLSKFVENPMLGVAGTSYRDVVGNLHCDYRFASAEDVPGACQMFRRKCFEEIGGYPPIKGGNLDTIAVLSARMKGWQTRAFTDSVLLHHRESGTAQGGAIVSRFKRGAKAYAIGFHPIWQLLRSLYQMTQRPFIIGGLALLSGYVWSLIRRPQRPVSAELVAFVQREQMQRLRKLFTSRWILDRKTL